MPVRLRPDAIWAFPFSSPARSKPLGSAGRCLCCLLYTSDAADVQMFVDEIKKHPYVSVALLDAVRGEVATLMQGQRFSFDFD